ncbi:DNA helicase RecQ [Plasticicumulans acidivorans]|uniref:DNA helicase RecQ n=1 Tax=Plasticicumulans acidivorans TaxID=886464 RepID=A0A317MR79_9GAMM|nr:DNA helicase RecQ [Plasticicumulans acidivorans]PWV59280.1 ATP-dependent DNA helicase RecQ [Plasticicumulans acidivorans]
MSDPALKILRSVFGYDAFRAQQAQIVAHVAGGADALVLMPTGGGKSLCYQIPALLRPGTGIVVSPLIALMHDQVDALTQLGVRAAYLNSSLDAEAARSVEMALLAGELDLLYVAPERLVSERFMGLLTRADIALFAIDEAHCVSQWGHDFRPEYIQLSVLHERFPAVPRIALTATADELTRSEIRERLGLTQAQVFLSSFDRPNIRYHLTPKHNARQQLLEFLRREHPGDAGIVYCLSRRSVDDTAAWLLTQGINALPYHAGLDNATRRQHQDRFLREEGLVMVATVAFGMGIDKPNVRFVAHLDLPKSLEGYYQETGRAGRDGLPASAWLAYGLNDAIQLRRMLAESGASEQHKRVEAHKLEAMLAFCETTRCRRQALLAYFGETYPEPCGNCDTCLQPVATWDGTVAAQKALSCVYRTGNRFGVGHLIDVLLGKASDKVHEHGHQHVSTFGIGSELDVAGWRSVYRQLIAAGMLAVDLEGYGALRLTEAARPVLRGETRLLLRRDPTPKGRSRDARPARDGARRDGPQLAVTDRALWEALRARRTALAREQGVPPYVIFHDATLVEMIERAPRSLAELGTVSGVGHKKLERYGEDFLAVLLEHAGVEAPAASVSPAEQAQRLFLRGAAVDEIAGRLGQPPAQILGHLAGLIRRGEAELEEVVDLDADARADIEAAFMACDDSQWGTLEPIHAALGGRWDYGVLKCVREALLRML